jgi:subtilisin family serine protease
MMMCLLFAISLTIFVGSLFAQGPGKDGLVSVVIKLEDAPLASYKGSVPGLAATDATVTGEKRLNVRSDTSRKYLAHIVQKMQTVESSILAVASQASVTHRYPVVFGGMTVRIPQDKVSAISRISGVKAVYPDRLKKVDTSKSPYLIKADKMWAILGGQSNGGEGVIVGIIDTGIWPEHPSFSVPDQGGKAYSAPPPSWGGACQAPGDDSMPITCTNKIIGARSFLSAYKAGMGGLPVGEFDSARDAAGHGTHVASTAAGNALVSASVMGNNIGTLSGVAPRAHVAAYKACGPEGCYDSDLVAAINQAVADGVDVINYSIGPSSIYLEDPYVSLDDLAFLDAYRAGVFVATSAGNSGPSQNTVNHLGGWTATVAASTNNRTFANTIKLKAKGGSLKLNGVSVTAGIDEATDFVLAADYGDELCLGPFDAGTFTGKIVGCKRGNNDRVAKGFNVLRGGAAGMVLYNTTGTAQGVSPDNHHLPAIHIDGSEGDMLVNYVATHPDIQATFTGGKEKKVKGDVVASFSSRGGAGQSYGISKPDIAAPGVTILAGNTEEPNDPTTKAGELFTIMQGTSMASPHVAGAGALLKQLNPTWTPGQIKSALMTTATTKKVVKEDGKTAADPFEVGSGRIDLQKAIKPGITFDAAGDDFITHKDALWNVNYPSIYISAMDNEITITRTAHSELASSSKWKISAKAPADLSIVAVPSSLEIPADGYSSISITINASAVPTGAVRHATLFMKSGSYQVHIPVIIVKAP